MFFDSPKDVVFDNVLCFPGINWVQKWAKTVKFGYVSLPLKDIILRDYPYTVIFAGYSAPGPNFNKI